MSDEKNQTPIIKAKKADVTTEKWHEFQREQQQKAPERIEDAAKYLAGMISISLTIFLKTDEERFADWANSPQLNFAVGIWLLSLLSSFFVLFPVPYRFSSQSVDSIKQVHQKTIHYKYAWLIASAVFFFVALLLVSITIFF